MKIVWHKHELKISSMVSSGYPDKYSYEIFHEYLPGGGNLSGKAALIKRNHYNHSHNFLRLFWAILPNVCFTTSKTKSDY